MSKPEAKKYMEFWLLNRDGKIGHWAYDTESAAVHSGAKTASESFGVINFIQKQAYDDLKEENAKLRGALEKLYSDQLEVDRLNGKWLTDARKTLKETGGDDEN